jgi:CO/xanthine dehydrogenase FAD-binding subunit
MLTLIAVDCRLRQVLQQQQLRKKHSAALSRAARVLADGEAQNRGAAGSSLAGARGNGLL